MSVRSSRRRTVSAVGSVIDIWPAGDYSEYVPRGSVQEHLRGHWVATGSYLKKAIARSSKPGRLVKREHSQGHLAAHDD